MALLDDRVIQAITSALDGVSLRQSVVANNIANAATPGFRAREVSFESALASAVASGNPSAAEASVGYAPTPVKQDGNSVDMTREVTLLSTSGVQYEALVAAMNFKFSVVRAALGR